jgi:hypothetical protein
MVYGTYNELVTGAYKPTYNWGASHCGDYTTGLLGIMMGPYGPHWESVFNQRTYFLRWDMMMVNVGTI